MLRRKQTRQADGAHSQVYYRSQSLFPWLYVQDGRTWHVYASDGTWVQDKRALSKRAHAELEEISQTEGEALLAAGRAKTVDGEPPFRLHFTPPWKAPMLYLRVIATVAIAAAAVIFRGTVGSQPWNNPKSPWDWAVYAAVFLLWGSFFFAAWREGQRQRRYKPWERKDPPKPW